MSKERLVASATVTVTLEIQSFSTWGMDCGMPQIRRQASAEVISAIKKATTDHRIRAKIIGEPVVKAIIVEPH